MKKTRSIEVIFSALLCTFIVVLSAEIPSAFAVPLKGAEFVCLSAKAASKKDTLLATMEVNPSQFSVNGKTIRIKEAWIEQVKSDKFTYLCLTFADDDGSVKPDDLKLECPGTHFGRQYDPKKKTLVLTLLLPTAFKNPLPK